MFAITHIDVLDVFAETANFSIERKKGDSKENINYGFDLDLCMMIPDEPSKASYTI
jgi:hypothetical protein